MSRSSETIVIVPAKSGWQVWKGSQSEGLSLDKDPQVFSASEIDGLPKSGVLMAFPVRQATALPMKTAADDEDLFEDISAVHVEQMGFRPEIGAGKLFDTFALQQQENEEGRTLLPIVLASPAPGSIPLRSPESFDLSARVFPLPDEGIAVWEELGRWVFAIARERELLYFQGLTEAGLTASAAREINLALVQLQLQGCRPSAEKVIVWHEEGNAHYDVPEEFSKGLTLPVEAQPKPRPQVPQKVSKLLPEDIVAARYLRNRKRNITIAAVASVLAVVGLAGYCAWQLMEARKNLKDEMVVLKADEPKIQALQEHFAKWDELGPVVNQDVWPVQLLFNVSRAVPNKRGSQSGFRISRFEVGNGFITMEGTGAKIDQVNVFKENLRKSALLKGYSWVFPEPEQRKGQLWNFRYEGNPPGADPNLIRG